MTDIRKRLGCNITRLRHLRGLTQARLAEMVEISSTFMMHIEHGTRGASLETVELLANALGVDIPILFLRPPGSDSLSEKDEHRSAFVEYLEDQISLVIRNSFAERYSDT